MEDFIKTISESQKLLYTRKYVKEPRFLPPFLFDKALEQGLIVKKRKRFYITQIGREVIKEKITYIKE